MLFMSIWTYEPGQRDQAIKRRLEKGTGFSADLKVIGEWSDVAGGRGFMVTEAKDAKTILQGTMAWSDILKMQIIPILDTTEVLKLLK